MKSTILKKLFAGFLRTRRIARHFRRLVLLESLKEADVNREVPVPLTQELVAAAISDTDALLQRLESHADGLTEAQAAVIRQRTGLNEVEHEKPLPWWLHLWHCYKTPFDGPLGAKLQ